LIGAVLPTRETELPTLIALLDDAEHGPEHQSIHEERESQDERDDQEDRRIRDH
jgi:hypothetical protein